MKLNLGCGEKILPEFINIDCRNIMGVDVILDLENQDLPYESNSIDEIFLEDFLEHLSMARQRPFLMEVYRVLIVGGRLFIEMPDLEIIAQRYCGLIEGSPMQYKNDAQTMATLLYGGQNYEYDFHKWGYDQRSLRKVLEETGFKILDFRSAEQTNLLCWAEKVIK